MAFYKNALLPRAKIIQSIRKFFIRRDYLEVETPLIIPSPAPELHIDTIRTCRGFLHPSPELCMKRLLAAGYPKIFQICKCFRDKERGERHLPEFTMLEWYRAGADYMDLMDECEELTGFVAEELGAGSSIEYLGTDIDLTRPWERVTVKDAFFRYSPVSLEEAIDTDRFDEILVDCIEPNLNKTCPVFLYDYPAGLASLSRIKPSDESVAERFELYMRGLEIANAFSELNDADEQKKRFIEEEERRRRMGKDEYLFPDKFIEDLKQMPPSAGIAFGVDRLVMLLTNSKKIDDVVTYTPEEL